MENKVTEGGGPANLRSFSCALVTSCEISPLKDNLRREERGCRYVILSTLKRFEWPVNQFCWYNFCSVTIELSVL